MEISLFFWGRGGDGDGEMDLTKTIPPKQRPQPQKGGGESLVPTGNIVAEEIRKGDLNGTGQMY